MSWEELLSIVKESRDPNFINKPVSDCPNDGEPLRTGPNGELRCPFDGWTPDGTEPR
jgi:hypothetical protein